MSSSPQYLQFVLEQLSDLPSISCRPMMGEYILYYQDKIIGGIYDNRLLIKPVKSALSLLKDPVYETPYLGAKQMLLIQQVEDKGFLTSLIKTIYDDLPTPKPKKKKQ
ncbi:TfoX/Sxy family protein [Negativibacillus massiliensis]|uniref:TfoX/Sxy family protein n=1 Tax=Negativibacillus massiliensis TaxID=1871035 RepID=UPI003AF2125A